jgi:branched-chain amino acid transport system permease protein
LSLWVMLVGWILVGIFALVVWLLMRSPWGRVLKAIREDEVAVASLGKNVYSYKMQALILGGVIGTFSGFILALDRGSVQPDNYSRDVTFYILTALVLGGVARVSGSIVGPMIFWFVLVFAEGFITELAGSDQKLSIGPVDIISNSTQIGQFRFMIAGALLIILMVFRPQGLFGDKREMALDAR